MDIEVRELPEALVFELSGNLRAQREDYPFLKQLREKLAGGARKIVIDLGGVEGMDSGGVGLLASAVTSAGNAGAQIGFCSIPAKAEKLIVIVGLMRVLNVYPTLEDALADL